MKVSEAFSDGEYGRLFDHAIACREHWKTIYQIRRAFERGEFAHEYAAEAWFELTNDERISLWRAETKAGCFYQWQREIIKSTEFRELYYGNE